MISQELLDRIMDMVPDYQTFMTVDEMAVELCRLK